MNRLILALALTPALLTTGVFAQSVSEDVTRQLWCGTAFTVVFGTLPDTVTDEQRAESKVYSDAGAALIAEATQAHLDAGFTQEAVDKIKADLVPAVTTQVGGDGSSAQFSFEDCAALIPQPAVDASSSAQ